jgi:hypothetical protein
MIQTGDLGSFVRFNHQDILRILYSKGYRDPDVAKDLCQDLYLSMAQYESLSSYDASKGSYEGYIYCILNRCISKANAKAYLTASNPPEDLSPSYQSVVDRIKDFQAYCRKNNVPRLDQINNQIKARMFGEFKECPERFHFLRIRKRFLDAERS